MKGQSAYTNMMAEHHEDSEVFEARRKMTDLTTRDLDTRTEQSNMMASGQPVSEYGYGTTTGVPETNVS